MSDAADGKQTDAVAVEAEIIDPPRSPNLPSVYPSRMDSLPSRKEGSADQLYVPYPGYRHPIEPGPWWAPHLYLIIRLVAWIVVAWFGYAYAIRPLIVVYQQPTAPFNGAASTTVGAPLPKPPTPVRPAGYRGFVLLTIVDRKLGKALEHNLIAVDSGTPDFTPDQTRIGISYRVTARNGVILRASLPTSIGELTDKVANVPQRHCVVPVDRPRAIREKDLDYYYVFVTYDPDQSACSSAN